MKNKNYFTNLGIKKIGFKKFGKNNLISKDARFYNPGKIIIGSNCRIDDFVIISASKKEVIIGDNVNIGRSSHLNGSGGLIIKNNVILSTFVCIHTSNHEYVNFENKKISYGKIEIFDDVIIGSNSILLGPLKMRKNSSLGSLSLLKNNTKSKVTYAGIPAKEMK